MTLKYSRIPATTSLTAYSLSERRREKSRICRDYWRQQRSPLYRTVNSTVLNSCWAYFFSKLFLLCCDAANVRKHTSTIIRRLVTATVTPITGYRLLKKRKKKDYKNLLILVYFYFDAKRQHAVIFKEVLR